MQKKYEKRKDKRVDTKDEVILSEVGKIELNKNGINDIFGKVEKKKPEARGLTSRDVELAHASLLKEKQKAMIKIIKDKNMKDYHKIRALLKLI